MDLCRLGHILKSDLQNVHNTKETVYFKDFIMLNPLSYDIDRIRLKKIQSNIEIEQKNDSCSQGYILFIKSYK